MKDFRVGIVGPCTSGKSTLVAALRQRGIQGKHIAQEHSFVQDMWKRITNPDLLIYLDVSFPVSLQRRKLNWTQQDYQEQIRRLMHARQHADFYLQTDELSIEEVLKQVLIFLEQSSPTS